MVRAIFGLSGLLVTIGVIVYLMGAKGGELDQTKAVLDARQQVMPEVNQIAGRNADGSGKASDSASLEIQTSHGNTSGIQVLDVQPDGAYAKFWGLQKDDFITQIGDEPVKGGITSQEDADSAVLDAYQNKRPLNVTRDGLEITLPMTPPPQQPGKAAGVRPVAQGAVQMLNNALGGSGAQIPSH